VTFKKKSLEENTLRLIGVLMSNAVPILGISAFDYTLISL